MCFCPYRPAIFGTTRDGRHDRSIYPDEFANFVERMEVMTNSKSKKYAFDMEVVDPLLGVVLDTDLGADTSRARSDVLTDRDAFDSLQATCGSLWSSFFFVVSPLSDSWQEQQFADAAVHSGCIVTVARRRLTALELVSQARSTSCSRPLRCRCSIPFREGSRVARLSPSFRLFAEECRRRF